MWGVGELEEQAQTLLHFDKLWAWTREEGFRPTQGWGLLHHRAWGSGGGLEPNSTGLFGSVTPQGGRRALTRQQGVLEATNSMEEWLSLFRYLVDTEARGDGIGSNPELAGFASRARQSAFKTPLRDNGTKRALEETLEDETEDVPPIILGLQDAIMGIQGELGVRYPNASYVTIHGGLKNLKEDMRGLQEGVDVQLRGLHSGHQAETGALKLRPPRLRQEAPKLSVGWSRLRQLGDGLRSRPRGHRRCKRRWGPSEAVATSSRVRSPRWRCL